MNRQVALPGSQPGSRFLRALGENHSKFEGTYGEIKLPEGFSLADHLFKPPAPK